MSHTESSKREMLSSTSVSPEDSKTFLVLIGSPSTIDSVCKHCIQRFDDVNLCLGAYLSNQKQLLIGHHVLEPQPQHKQSSDCDKLELAAAAGCVLSKVSTCCMWETAS